MPSNACNKFSTASNCAGFSVFLERILASNASDNPILFNTEISS